MRFATARCLLHGSPLTLHLNTRQQRRRWFIVRVLGNKITPEGTSQDGLVEFVQATAGKLDPLLPS
jgi:hypothetical protein